jgi:hypothetical protein
MAAVAGLSMGGVVVVVVAIAAVHSPSTYYYNWS